MNTKLLASFAVFVLLAAVVGPSLTSSASAASDAFMKIDGVKGEAKEKKAEMKAKKDDKKTAQTSAKAAPSGEALKEVTVDMAKGTASDTNCGDKCYIPSTVTIAVGGKVTWKNVDSAAHTSTASDGSFDTSLVNAGASASNTFNTAGSYPYMCILHPWMKGTVTVQ